MRTYLHEIISDRLHDGWQNECARCFCFLSCVVFASTKSMDGLLLSNFDAYARAHRVRRINTCMFENVAGYRRTCSLLHCVSLLIFFSYHFCCSLITNGKSNRFVEIISDISTHCKSATMKYNRSNRCVLLLLSLYHIQVIGYALAIWL